MTLYINKCFDGLETSGGHVNDCKWLSSCISEPTSSFWHLTLERQEMQIFLFLVLFLRSWAAIFKRVASSREHWRSCWMVTLPCFHSSWRGQQQPAWKGITNNTKFLDTIYNSNNNTIYNLSPMYNKSSSRPSPKWIDREHSCREGLEKSRTVTRTPEHARNSGNFNFYQGNVDYEQPLIFLRDTGSRVGEHALIFARALLLDWGVARNLQEAKSNSAAGDCSTTYTLFSQPPKTITNKSIFL